MRILRTEVFTMRMKLACALFLLCLPTVAIAQADPGSVHLRNDCRLATQVLTTGQPRPKLQWASQMYDRCPGFAAQVASAMLRARTSTDTAYLNAITFPANQLQDRAVFEAALEISADRGASIPARVYANRVLYWIRFPSAGTDYTTLVDVDGDGRTICTRYGPSSHASVQVIQPLPTDWRARIHAVTSTVMRNMSEPSPVRQSAVCVALTTRPE
ncbi:hypothetical protein [Longimicrobium sp.]|jgi:hypothetical protein|uniref:hypothetical protein n=1 Tax=Longimicrobium sp. TaxID=2029185 RepID=UPI002ED948CD